jgi:AcrR family transcriptional regulator
MKKKTEKSLKTKAHIYKTAIELFQSEGYEKATMRAIAKKAKISLGLTYYHFKTKEEIVFHFYENTQIEAEMMNSQFFQKETDFKKRVKHVLTTKIEQFNPYSNFLHVLAQTASNPKSKLSPFSPETEPIRREAIQIFKNALEGSNYKPPEDIRIALPSILWLYQMGILYFWIWDKSSQKSRTLDLIDFSFDLVFRLLRISRLPFMKPIRRSILKIYSFVLESVV